MSIISEIKKDDFIQGFLQDLILDDKSAKYIEKAVKTITNLTSDYIWSIPRKANIPKGDGSYREVFIFEDEDSIILKAINKYLTNNYDHLLSDRVYSYKTGVNSKLAVNDLLDKSGPTINYIKTDISKYFNRVNKKSINEAIDVIFKDKEDNKMIKNLYSIDSYYTLSKDGAKTISKEYLGLMPGTAISAYMSNFMLRKIDSFLYNNCDYYIRYSDDILIADSSIKNLTNTFSKLRGRLKKFDLYINDSKTELVENATSLTYLGLKIDLDSETIDISDKNYKKLTGDIKAIAKKYRKEYELSIKYKSNINIDIFIERAISAVNKRLYLGTISNGIHKNSSLVYLFNCINTVDTIKTLEFYIVDKLRFIKTGRNNAGNIKAISVRELENLGYKSCVQMYNLFHLNSDMFNSEVASLLNKDELRVIPLGYLNGTRNYTHIDLEPTDFITFVKNSRLLGNTIICNNAVYNTESIRVDLKNNAILLDNNVIFEYKNNELIRTNTEIYTLCSDTLYKYNSNNRLISVPVSEDTVYKYYINTCSNLPIIKFEGGFNPYKSIYSIDIYNFFLNGFEYEETYNNPLIFALNLMQYKLDNIRDKSKEYLVLGDLPKFNLALKVS